MPPPCPACLILLRARLFGHLAVVEKTGAPVERSLLGVQVAPRGQPAQLRWVQARKRNSLIGQPGSRAAGYRVCGMQGQARACRQGSFRGWWFAG